MSGLESTIRELSDAELLEMLRDPDAYEPEAREFAKLEIEQRGGADELVDRERRQVAARGANEKVARATRIPFRGRFVAWVLIVFAVQAIIYAIVKGDQLTNGDVLVIVGSTCVILHSVAVLQSSPLGIASLSFFLGLLAVGTVAFALLAGEDVPWDARALALIPAVVPAVAAGLVFSCWKAARRIRAFRSEESETVDETE